MTKKERGKWAKGYEGIYMVSNFGRVKSVDRTEINSNGIVRKLKGKVLRPDSSNKGYLMVNLSKDNKAKTVLVHRIVAEAWVPNPENLPVVMHSDDDPSNNCVSNLKWGTQQDNMDDKVSKDRQQKGSRVWNSTLTEKDIIKIRGLLAKGEAPKDIAAKFKVTPSHVSNIKRGKRWSYIT